MEKKIEIKGIRAEELSSEYFVDLLKNRYGIKVYFTVAYEPIKDAKDRGIVTVAGENFNLSEIYTALTRHFVVQINTETKGKNLEDRLGDK